MYSMPVAMYLNRQDVTSISCFSPYPNTTLIAKKYSKVQDGSVVAVAESRSQSQTIQFETVRGYIAVVYDDRWWPGYALQKYEENEEFKIRFLHPHGLSPSFVSPLNQIS
jgi:hypothetical protein